MPNKQQDYHIYSHNNPAISTMGDFVVEPDSLGIGFDIAQLLIYENEDGVKNLDSLISLYTKDELKEYQSLIDQIRNTKPKQEQESSPVVINNQKNEEGIIIADENKEESSKPFVTVKNSASLKAATQFTAKELAAQNAFILENGSLSIGASNENSLSKIPFLEARLIFKKFLKRIIAETGLFPRLTSVVRTKEQQHDQVEAGNSDSEASLHVFGLAIDLNLEDLEWDSFSPPRKQFYKKSDSIATWKAAGDPTLVVDIARDMKIRWGGTETFTKKGADTVHFDLSNYYNVDKARYVKSLNLPEQETVASEQESEAGANDKYLDLPLKVGTIFALPLAEVDRDVLSTETNQTVNSIDFEAFLAKQLVDLLSDPGYKRTFIPKTQPYKGSVQEIYPYISVWVWSRSLSISSLIPSSEDDKTQYEHRIINITPYILSLNTNVGENGGNFSMQLAPITADIRNQSSKTNSFLGKGWKVMEGTQKASPLNKKDYVNQSHVHYIEKDELKRNRMYFDKVLQQNDVVFIRFERLLLEDRRKNLDELETISVNDLPNQIFDMIALIDNVSHDTQYATVDSTVSVDGRDLVKLIIEDGVYFYPTDFTSTGIFSNTGATNTRLGRFGRAGEYLSRFQVANKTIDRSLKFIINNLGTIEICPNDLFNGYANAKLNITQPASKFNSVDKRSRAYQIINQQEQEEKELLQENNDEKDRILDNIRKIIKSSNIKSVDEVNVFNIIQSFLQDRIANKEITVLNQKIKSWKEIVDGEVRENILPNELDNAFFIADRIWLDEKNRAILLDPNSKPPILTIVSIYNRQLTKDNIASTKVDSLKNLARKEQLAFKKKRYFIDKILYDRFVSEINDYVNAPLSPPDSPIVFTINDVNVLNSVYNSTKKQGKSLTLGILSKTLSDLTTDEKAVFNDIYSLITKETSQKKQPVEQEFELLAGIWQIIKLVIDDSVKDRRITDASIGNENGSILNAFRKICQDPFCEFYTDTYGDQFYFIARKKPFDLTSITSVLEGRVAYDQPTPIDVSKVSDNEAEFQGFTGVPSPVQNLIIDIEETDVLSDSLRYSTEAYSWYRLQLANNTSGSSADMAFAYLKGIYFNEFADIYGSKPLDLTTSYIPYSPIIDKNKKLPTAYFIKQGIYDLKYMIESHAHLPFTRMGTIVMNGDRRIKRGNFVRLKATGEIFYVEGVSHSYAIDMNSIERITTIQVSRGMVERFIKGVTFNVGEEGFTRSQFPVVGEEDMDKNLRKKTVTKVGEINISYFNICDLSIDDKIFENADSSFSAFSEASTKRWKVNKSVFNFFLKKLQFAKNDKEIFDAGVNLFGG